MRATETGDSPFIAMVWQTVCVLIAGLFSMGVPLLAEDRLICCGAEEVFILDLTSPRDGIRDPIWSWKAEDSPEIPEAGKKSFASTDECKPFGEFLLITSSSGGVALVRRSDKRCVFYTQAKNAHSACLLPGYRLAVASSFGGDQLLVYELAEPGRVTSGVALSPAEPVTTMALRGAHGAVWDEKRERLWALGSDELLLLQLGDRKRQSKLRIDQRIPLPTAGGHDLSPSSDKQILFVTTNEHVYRFRKETAEFTLDPVLADQLKVKSVAENQQTGEIVYHQGTPENWWSDRIRFVGKRADIQLPGRRLYKIRWDE